MPPKQQSAAAAPQSSARATATRAASGRSKASAANRQTETQAEAEAHEDEARASSSPARCSAQEKENAVPVAASAVPATPAPRSKAPLPSPAPAPSPSPSHARTPLRPANGNTICATPAPAARRVQACTPSVASAPLPLPPRPAVLSTDPTLVRALDTVFKKVDAISTGFAAAHGPPLEVAPLYADLAAAKSAKDLAMVCHKLGLYLMREWKLIPAQQMQTMSAQYMRACKVLPHLAAEMDYFVVTCQAKAISVCQAAAAPALMDACRSASDKLIADCASQAANESADAIQRFSFHRTTLWTHFEMLHMQVQRALAVIQAGQTQLAHPLIATARQDASLFLSKLSSMLKTPLSSSQHQQLSEATRKLVDDLMLIISTATLSSRPGDTDWTQLIHSLCENEMRECATICNDTHLERWRTAKLLQQVDSAQPTDRRLKSIALLQLLPVSHGYPTAAASSKSSPSALPCLTSLGVLMSLYEQAFLTPLLAPASAAAETLRSSLFSAIARVNADPASTEEDKRYAHGLYFLALSCLAAATPSVAGALASPSPLHASYKHSYQSLKHFRSLLMRTTDEMEVAAVAAASSAATPAVAPVRRHWPLLLDYTRCLYFRAVLAEHQGLHSIAQSLLENAMSTLSQVLYDPMQRSASADASGAIPFASLVVGKMHRARILSKLDRWDAAQELLSWSQINDEASASHAGACGAPFLGPYAVHARQILQWQQRQASSETELSEQLQRMAMEESKANSCAQCYAHLSSSPSPLPLVPCSVDTLMVSCASPSVSRAFLDSVLLSHALWRPPPLMRLVHHAVARLLMDDNDHGGAAFHMHEAMALTARHEAWGLGEGAKESDNTAAKTTSQIKAFDQERKLFDEAFVSSLPADWSVCSIDLDVHGSLLLSRLQCGSLSTARVSAVPLFPISAAFSASLCLGNEASALAKDYNSTVKPALLNRADGKKPPAKELSQAKAMVSRIESNRTAADTGIAECCAALERFLGAHVEFLRGSGGGPVVLVLGPGVGHLPWENLPTLRSQCMTRMAAWSFICAIRAQANRNVEAQASASASLCSSPSLLPGVSSSCGYFVLNPQSNLLNAESHLRSLLSSNGTWLGSCGPPDVSAWLRALQQRGYFTYVGHNGGEEFVPTKAIRAMAKPAAAAAAAAAASSGQRTGDKATSDRTGRLDSPSGCPPTGVLSVCFQIGCSSGLQHCVKSGAAPLYDSDGLSVAYQLAGCPSMFGCLWNVTDDIDQWTSTVVTAIQTNKHAKHAQDAPAQTAEVDTKKKKTTTRKKNTANTDGAEAEATTAAAAVPACISLQALALSARSACKYAHLNGASIICYGLPISA